MAAAPRRPPGRPARRSDVGRARPDTRRGRNDSGYWRLGGDTLAGGPGATGVDRYLWGSMDEVAVYNDELSADAVAGHHRAAVG